MPGIDRTPHEEIRLAVVLNGGVSLAVWIGGATLEIDRLTRRESVYGQLLDLVDADARADVITGTSAGGINGAALALAQVSEAADIRSLRDLWARQGRMETLLRAPFSGQPASLLKGDEYFLPALENALQGLVRDFDPKPPEERPVNLTITTTLLEGARKVMSDALGQALPQQIHGGLMTFRHLEHDEGDDFTKGGVTATVRRLALAARSSASFPIAFEPSLLPVGTAADVSTRPDMSAVAGWFDPNGAPDQTRYAVDGGALVNTPTIPALEAIDALPASASVRRVMLLVFPHAPTDENLPASTEAEPPTLVETITGISHAMRNEAGRTHIEEVDAHNRRAGARRAGRSDVLLSLGRQAVDDDVVTLLAQRFDQLYLNYYDLRRRRSARDVAERRPAVPGWSYERVLAAIERAQAHVEPDGLPYLPPVEEALGWEFDPAAGWPWGVTTAENLVDDAIELTRRLGWVRLAEEDRVALQSARATLYGVRRELGGIRRDFFDRAWECDDVCDLPPNEPFWRLWLRGYRRAFVGSADLTVADVGAVVPLGDTEEAEAQAQAVRMAIASRLNRELPSVELGRKVTAEVAEVARALLALPAAIWRAEDQVGGDDAQVLKSWAALLTTTSPEELVTRMIRLDVVTSCLSNAPEHGSEQMIELVQVSLQSRNAFAEVTTSAADKLGGNRLGRFAGFLKESWRINDWTWGRLDGATMLCRVLLDPQRVRRTIEHVQPRETPARTDAAARVAARRWVNARVAELYPSVRPGPGFATVRDRAVADMACYVFAPDPQDLPPTLEGVADLYAWAVHCDIAAEELPALRVAVDADRRDGATQGSLGERFVQENRDLLDQLARVPPAPRGRIGPGAPDPDPMSATRRSLGVQALRAFDHAGVGREALDTEASGDQMIRTGVTAAAVGVTVLDSPRLGLPVAKPFTRTLRGAALLPYWVARGLTGGARIAQSLAIATLALGGAMLAISLLVPGAPHWVALVGVSAVLFALAYAALRTGSLLHGLVLMGPVIPLAAYAVAEQVDGSGTEVASVALLPFVAALIAGLIILGSLPGLVRTPFAVVIDRSRAPTPLLVGDLLIVMIVVGTVLMLVVRAGRAPAIAAALVIAGVVALGGAAYRRSASFRVRYFSPDAEQAEGQKDSFGTWTTSRVVLPEAVATAWAWVYMALTLLAGTTLWLILDVTDDPGSRLRDDDGHSPLGWSLWASVVGSGVIAVLLAATTVALPSIARGRLQQRMVTQVRAGIFAMSGPDPAADLVRRLRTSGTAYAYLTTPVTAEDGRQRDDLALSNDGRRLLAALHRAKA